MIVKGGRRDEHHATKLSRWRWGTPHASPDMRSAAGQPVRRLAAQRRRPPSGAHEGPSRARPVGVCAGCAVPLPCHEEAEFGGTIEGGAKGSEGWYTCERGRRGNSGLEGDESVGGGGREHNNGRTPARMPGAGLARPQRKCARHDGNRSPLLPWGPPACRACCLDWRHAARAVSTACRCGGGGARPCSGRRRGASAGRRRGASLARSGRTQCCSRQLQRRGEGGGTHYCEERDGQGQQGLRGAPQTSKKGPL